MQLYSEGYVTGVTNLIFIFSEFLFHNFFAILSRPVYVFMNPIRMESATKYKAISLDANEVLVVYQRERESGGVLRRIQYGPTVFTPSADEW